MSRLYEALKGASRARGTENDPERLWDVLNVNGMDVPDAQANARKPFEASSHSQETMAALASFGLEQPLLQKGKELGMEADAELDRSARLLPHAINPTLADHYRRLRTKILQQREIKPFRSVVVTSASPKEGKTVTVMNLALSFATLPDFKVLVIDGDLRRGTLGSWLGVKEEQPGLSNLLSGSAKLEEVVLKSEHIPMHFMVRGKDEIRDLHPSHFAGHFRRLSEIYDLVLIDSPPANLLADVQLLAASSDAVLLVARAFSTTRKSLERAAQELAPFRIIGAVLNAGVAQKSSRYYGYY